MAWVCPSLRDLRRLKPHHLSGSVYPTDQRPRDHDVGNRPNAGSCRPSGSRSLTLFSSTFSIGDTSEVLGCPTVGTVERYRKPAEKLKDELSVVRMSSAKALIEIVSSTTFRTTRRDGRVAEGARLESVFRGNSNVGSNPTLSAIFSITWLSCDPQRDPLSAWQSQTHDLAVCL